MATFPRVRMRSRLKLYNVDRTIYTIGTVMVRQGVYTYDVQFDGNTLRSVNLQDTTTWEFVQQHNTQNPVSPHISRKTFQYSVPPVPNLASEGSPAKEASGPENNLSVPSSAASGPATKHGPLEQINQEVPNFLQNKNECTPEESRSRQHLDCNPIAKLPPRMISGESTGGPARHLEYPSFKKKVPPRKRFSDRHVRFGKPTIVYFDADTGRMETRTSEETVRKRTEGSDSHTPEAGLESSTLQQDTSHVRKHDMKPDNTPNAGKGDNHKKRVMKPVGRKKLNKAKKPRDSVRISSLRKRNFEGKVVKSSNHTKIRTRTRPHRIRACQQREHKGDVQIEPTAHETGAVPAKPDGVGCSRDRKRDEGIEGQEVQKIEDEGLHEDAKPVETVKSFDETEVKRRMAPSIERLATIHTQQIINHIATHEDFFRLFPRMKYTEIGNKYYEEHCDFMFEFLPTIIRDATRLAEFCVEPGKDISLDNVITFLDHQVSWAVDRFTEIRIVEINRGIDNKRREIQNMTGTPSDCIQSTNSSTSGGD